MVLADYYAYQPLNVYHINSDRRRLSTGDWDFGCYTYHGSSQLVSQARYVNNPSPAVLAVMDFSLIKATRVYIYNDLSDQSFQATLRAECIVLSI